MKRFLVRYFTSILSGVVVVSCLSWAVAQTAADENAGAKTPGIIRVGVALPALQMGPAAAVDGASEGIRSAVMEYLAGPSFEVVPLTARLPLQIEAEGRQKACDFVLYSTLSSKQTGGAGLGLLKRASRMSNVIPTLGAVHGAAGSIAGTAAGTVIREAAVAASMVKAKTEVSFEYRLVAVGSSLPVLSDVLKTKAARDGEDVISGLVEKAAGAIAKIILNKKTVPVAHLENF